MNKIAFSTNFQIMIKKLLLFPLTLILLSSCSYHFSSIEAGKACNDWEWDQKKELRKKGKDTGSVRCLFDERSKQFLGIKYNARPNGSINYREYKVIKRYKY